MFKLFKLQNLIWQKKPKINEWTATGVNHKYTVRYENPNNPDDSQIQVNWVDTVKQTSGKRLSFKSFNEALEWVEDTHYPKQLLPYLKPFKSITGLISQWFKDAKPKPTSAQISTQFGAHIEEFIEMLKVFENPQWDFLIDDLDSLMLNAYANNLDIDFLKLTKEQRVALLDSLCDQNVTGNGIATMLGMDFEGGLAEVALSNDSKRNPDGSFNYNTDGKITKESVNYQEPVLEQFIGS